MRCRPEKRPGRVMKNRPKQEIEDHKMVFAKNLVDLRAK